MTIIYNVMLCKCKTVFQVKMFKPQGPLRYARKEEVRHNEAKITVLSRRLNDDSDDTEGTVIVHTYSE